MGLELRYEEQVLSVDESKVFQPPSQLQVPDDIPVPNGDLAMSAPDSDDNSSNDSSPSPKYADELNETSEALVRPPPRLLEKVESSRFLFINLAFKNCRLTVR